MGITSDIKAISLGLGNEFKAFIAKGNVVDLAVGVIIGASFGDIVKAMVADIITPLFTLFGKHGAGSALKGFESFYLGPFAIGHFINTIFSFLILAAVVFFLLVKPMNKLMASLNKKPATAAVPAPPEDVILLREIRDLLKEKQQSQQPPAVS